MPHPAEDARAQRQYDALHPLRQGGVVIALRTAFRLARLFLHLLWGAATVAVVFPFLPLAARRALKARWSRQLLATLGLRLRVAGRAPVGGFLVANHISWLDIYVINALAPAAFVSKDEVQDWPLVGWLARHTETIFLARGSRSAAMRTKEAIAAALCSGARVTVFPEGTTSDGDRVLPFHGALFQGAVDAGAAVTPLAVSYTGADGERSLAPSYAGEITLGQCLLAIARADGLTAHVAFLPALDAAAGDRRHLAHRAHRLIASRLARPDADTAVETPADLPDAPQSAGLPTGSPNPAPAGSLLP